MQNIVRIVRMGRQRLLGGKLLTNAKRCKRYRENPKNKKEIEKYENSEMRKLQKSLWHLKKVKTEVETLKVTVKGQEIEEDVSQTRSPARSRSRSLDRSRSRRRSCRSDGRVRSGVVRAAQVLTILILLKIPYGYVIYKNI